MTTRLWRSKASGIVAALVVILGLGCEGSQTPPVSSSDQKATVKGTVTVKGALAKEGTVNFDPANVNRRDAPIASAKIGPDGAYSLETLVGENHVSIQTPMTQSDPSLQYYSDTVEVTSGTFTHNIVVPKP